MLRATHIDLGPQHWTVPQQPSTSNPELALLIGIELYLSVGNLPPGKSDLTITSPPLPIEFGTPELVTSYRARVTREVESVGHTSSSLP